MPSWAEYKDTARSRGALALELYVVESTPEATPEQLKETLPDHLEYQKQLEAAGHLVLAGPLSNDSGELMEGNGLIIYRAASLEAARVLAEADPMHLKQYRTYRIRRWLVNEGSLNLQVRLAQQSVVFE